jgi:biotin operon repressor
MENRKTRFELSKPLCVLSVLAGTAAAGIQLAIDIWQGITPDMIEQERFIQIGQMSLITVFVVILGAIAGTWISNGHWKWAVCLYIVAGVCMGVTASNGMDFLANKTVARTQAQIKQATASKDITDIKNSIALQERKEKADNLWRTYLSAKPGNEKDKVLSEIKQATSESIDLKTDVGVVQLGVGGTVSHHFGWRPEAIQEARAVTIPIVTMILKALLISIGFGCWPNTAAKQWETFPPVRLAPAPSPESTGKVTYEIACKDMLSMVAIGGRAESQRELAHRWGTSEAQVSKWLPRMRRDGVPIKFEMNGNRRAVVAAPHVNGNGSGRVLGNA